MTKKIDWEKADKEGQMIGVIDDIFMLVLIVLNLAFIIFDWNFGFEFFRNFLQNVSPEFYVFYRDHIHPNFLLYDLIFVSIFLLELLIRWGIAIKEDTYGRWFFYPFIHWYDVLGCIPIGAFRWLRVLRIFSLMMRMHRMGVINLKETYVFRKSYGLYKIFVEEITDRVIINMLDGVQREIAKESQVTDSMLSEVIRPHVDTISHWLANRIQQITEDSFSQYKDDLKAYIEKVVKEGFDNSKEVKRIEAIPILGKQITGTVEDSISDITYQLIHSMAYNIASEENERLIKHSISATLDSMLLEKKDKELDRITKNIFVEALEKIKNNVGVKEYKKNPREPEGIGDMQQKHVQQEKNIIPPDLVTDAEPENKKRPTGNDHSDGNETK